MAEAFARALGAGVLDPASGGLNPVGKIPPEVGVVMAEEGISVEGQWSKAIEEAHGPNVDLVVDLVGGMLPDLAGIPVRRRPVVDPYGQGLDAYRRTRDTVRLAVEALIAELRRK
jgi:protein-tyrosine-phosphatase